MGCVNGKSSLNSPPHSRSSVDRLKRNNRYARRGGSRERLTCRSQNNSRALSDSKHVHGKVTVNNTSKHGSSSSADAGKGGREITKEAEEEKSEVGNVSKRFVEKKIVRDEYVDGWPKWLVDNISKDVLASIVPKSADSYVKLAKVGRGTYSNVYKARDKDSGKIVALKKVRFDTSDSDSIKFMAREIMILQRLDHPNVLKLEGLATSRMQYSLYLVFDFMQSDLSRVINRPGQKLTEPQIKCYMQQLLSGLQHCHDRGVMHRDIKASNLLIDGRGVLKIGDFGLASCVDLRAKGPLTNRVVTLWYRAPELLLGSTDYGNTIDLWSAGCLLAEMFTARPIMPGRTEVEQLHMIIKLCGSPPENYWKKLKLTTSYRPPQHYKPNYQEAFRNFPSSFVGLLTTLLDLDPDGRGSAETALQSAFFKTSPFACDPSALPVVNKADNERSQIKRRKKHKTLGRRESSQTNRAKKQTAEQLGGDSEISKVKNEEPKMHSPSSGSKLFTTSEGSSMNSSLSPVYKSSVKQIPRTDAHPNALKNIKNYALLQASIIDIINRNEGNEFAHLRRSFSALDSRLDPDKLANLYGFDKNLVHEI